MTINHHLSDPTLLSYAAGNVSEASSLVIVTHVHMCSECRQKLNDLELLGGLSLEDSPVSSINPDALEIVLEHIAKQESIPEKPNCRKINNSDIPAPLQSFLPHGLSEINWKMVAPGIKSFSFSKRKSKTSTIRLLKISPGTAIPEHSHGGMELTLVLKGSFSDGKTKFFPGDVADLDEDTQHNPIVDNDEDCICLIATDAPLKFSNFIPRLAQLFTGV